MNIKYKHIFIFCLNKFSSPRAIRWRNLSLSTSHMFVIHCSPIGVENIYACCSKFLNIHHENESLFCLFTWKRLHWYMTACPFKAGTHLSAICNTCNVITACPFKVGTHLNVMCKTCNVSVYLYLSIYFVHKTIRHSSGVIAIENDDVISC